MNLGFYVETCGGTPQNMEIYKFLNKAIADGELEDASVFFNSINFNPITPRFGMFDATELWHFRGNLVCSSLDNLKKVSRVVNNIKAVYLFSADQKNERNIFDLVQIGKICRVVTLNVNDQKEFKRLTGTEPLLVEEMTVQNFRGVFDG